MSPAEVPSTKNIQKTYKKHTKNTQKTHKKHTKNIQKTYTLRSTSDEMYMVNLLQAAGVDVIKLDFVGSWAYIEGKIKLSVHRSYYG